MDGDDAEASSNVAAYASACQQDQNGVFCSSRLYSAIHCSLYLGRPVLGHVNVATVSIDMEQQAIDNILLHEVFHVLGFSGALYPSMAEMVADRIDIGDGWGKTTPGKRSVCVESINI